MRYDDAGRVIELFHELNLDVENGTSLAITGESGVGKTTLLYILGGLEYPVGGKVHIGDTCVTDIAHSRRDMALFRGRHVGFVFQFHQLLPEFDAVENVAMPLVIRGERRVDALVRATELLQRVGLGERLTHRPGMLSGGEQQRVALARALAGNPGVLLADEPTGNLDERTGGEITDLLLELHRENAITLIVVTHSRDLARRMDRCVELRGGGMIEERVISSRS